MTAGQWRQLAELAVLGWPIVAWLAWSTGRAFEARRRTRVVNRFVDSYTDAAYEVTFDSDAPDRSTPLPRELH